MAAAVDNVVSRSEKVNNSLINDEETDSKRVYDEKVLEYYASHAKTEQNVKIPWSLDRISQVMKQIKESRVTTQKKSMDYYLLSKYDILETANEEYLIFKKKCVDDHTIRIILMEKYFEILKEVHKTVGHGGRLKMIQHIKNRLYIPKKPIELFVDLCSVCQKKRAVPKKCIVTQPIISKDFNTRGQVNLIDIQSAADGEFKWLMNYQDLHDVFDV